METFLSNDNNEINNVITIQHKHVRKITGRILVYKVSIANMYFAHGLINIDRLILTDENEMNKKKKKKRKLVGKHDEYACNQLKSFTT